MLSDETKLVFVAQFIKGQFPIKSTWSVTFHFTHMLCSILTYTTMTFDEAAHECIPKE